MQPHPAPGVEPSLQWKTNLKSRIDANLQHLLLDAKATYEAQLARTSDYMGQRRLYMEYLQTTDNLRAFAEDEYAYALQRERQELEWLGGAVPGSSGAREEEEEDEELERLKKEQFAMLEAALKMGYGEPSSTSTQPEPSTQAETTYPGLDPARDPFMATANYAQPLSPLFAPTTLTSVAEDDDNDDAASLPASSASSDTSSVGEEASDDGDDYPESEYDYTDDDDGEEEAVEQQEPQAALPTPPQLRVETPEEIAARLRAEKHAQQQAEFHRRAEEIRMRQRGIKIEEEPKEATKKDVELFWKPQQQEEEDEDEEEWVDEADIPFTEQPRSSTSTTTTASSSSSSPLLLPTRQRFERPKEEESLFWKPQQVDWIDPTDTPFYNEYPRSSASTSSYSATNSNSNSTAASTVSSSASSPLLLPTSLSHTASSSTFTAPSNLHQVFTPMVIAPRSEDDLVRLLTFHMEQWERVSFFRSLQWSDLPWPMLNFVGPRGEGEVTREGVKEYVIRARECFGGGPTNSASAVASPAKKRTSSASASVASPAKGKATPKTKSLEENEKLRELLGRWNPETFAHEILTRVPVERGERERVRRGAEKVGMILREVGVKF